MLDLARHPYFEEYIDEQSGVKSYILKKREGILQQHFYFINSSLTDDGKYLWIFCSFPPAKFRTLAVISMDSDNPFFRTIPAAGFSLRGSCPCIIPGTHDVLYGEEGILYRVNVDGEVTKVLELDAELINFRKVDHLMTHASLSADRKYIILDAWMDNKTYVATGNLETGEVKLIHKMGRYYDHAQFSPIHQDLFIIDQDWWRDSHTGEYFTFDNRIWLMDTKGTRFEPLLQKSWFKHDGTEVCHDFWSKDGLVCWTDYLNGVFECDVETREVTHVWKRPLCHSHTNADRSLWCADESPYKWTHTPCKVIFFDRKSGKDIDIFSAMPYPEIRSDRFYHIDPHPSFTNDGEYIISTTTVCDGNVDIAITPVKPLVELCREKGTLRV